MKEKLILILKGLIIGAGKIIPGVSGGMLAITLNVYDQGIDAISNFFKNIKRNFTFLFTISIGILVSVFAISKLIKISLNYFYLPTMLLFIGMIIGGIPPIIKEAKQEKSIKNIIIMLIPFILVFFMSSLSHNLGSSIYRKPNFGSLILVGLIDSATMIIPGISGTAILMMLGYYDMIIESLSLLNNLSLFIPNMIVLIPFAIGIVLGIIVLSKIINYLLIKYRGSCYYAIIGFSISSILLLLGETLKNNYNFLEITVSMALLLIGYFISSKLEKIH